MPRRSGFAASVVLVMLLIAPAYVFAAPKAELWGRWSGHDETNQEGVDHSAWDGFLKSYLVAGTPSGINLVMYSHVKPKDKMALADYIAMLENVRVTGLSRAVQKAYWINLYNALTIKVILDHYPVERIRNIDISPGWFSDGPWGAKLVRIEGEEVSLDDIEHKILRPIWKDNRVHYAVNCASLSCPNLQPEAFTADNTERLLEKGAREYVNHPRGANMTRGGLTLSSIYDWFVEDFGGDEDGVVKHLMVYADKPLASKLEGYSGTISYEYDWSLNESR